MSKKPNKHKPPRPADLRLPLYRLYQGVKRLDQQSGHATVDTQSYLLLLETLRRGYGLGSHAELLLLCEKLWLKPYHLPGTALNRETLGRLFNEALQEVWSEAEMPALPASPPLQPNPARNRRSTDDKKPIPPKSDQPVQPSEPDKALSRQQGGLNVAVAAVPGDAQTAASTPPEFVDQFSDTAFMVKGIYLPVNPRRIEQSIRSYRYRVKGHGQLEVDWDKTAADIARKGYFDRFQFREQDLFNTGWTVLIDHSASMAAFKAYSEEIAGAIEKGNGGGSSDNIFYFQNYPVSHLFYNRLQSSSIPVERFAAGARRNILVISDAGAARGWVSEERIMGTLKFLRRLQKHRVAWMNPLPSQRWASTSAELIAGYTDMFDIGEGSRDSLSNIVRLFKSKITTQK